MTENEAINELKNYRTCSGTKFPKEIEVAIQALEEIQQYRAIGTVEEFKALKEKNDPKKIVKCENDYKCPICNHWVGFRCGYCDGCGQALDWGRE